MNNEKKNDKENLTTKEQEINEPCISDTIKMRKEQDLINDLLGVDKYDDGYEK